MAKYILSLRVYERFARLQWACKIIEGRTEKELRSPIFTRNHFGLYPFPFFNRNYYEEYGFDNPLHHLAVIVRKHSVFQEEDKIITVAGRTEEDPDFPAYTIQIKEVDANDWDPYSDFSRFKKMLKTGQEADVKRGPF